VRSRLIATLAVSAAASAATLTFAAPAVAYPPINLFAVISDNTTTPGEPVTGRDNGNDPGEQVNGYVHSTPVFVGSTTANAKGVATLNFTIPTSLALGTHTLRLVGQSSGRVGSVQFTVSRAGSNSPASGASGLPFTGGSDIWQLTAGGAGLVLLGGAALVVVRRRRAHSALAA
jgi:LPXTG-motif cell wall-anchored protein